MYTTRAFGVDLKQADRNCLGESVEQLLALSERLLRGHLIRDVDHLGDDAAVLGILQQVVVRHLEPDPRFVLALQSLPHPPAGPWVGEHLHPVLDRQRVVVGMDELEGPVADQLVGAPPEDLGQLC